MSLIGHFCVQGFLKSDKAIQIRFPFIVSAAFCISSKLIMILSGKIYYIYTYANINNFSNYINLLLFFTTLLVKLMLKIYYKNT